MKTSCILLLVAVLGPFVHARVVSDNSAISSNDVTTECRYEATPGKTIPYTLLLKQYECYKPSTAFLGSLNTAPTKDAYRTIFQSACAHEASVRACIADVGVAAPSCLDALEMKTFTVVRDFVEASITATCADRSEAVATMYADGLKPMSLSQQIRVVSCLTSVAAYTMYDAEPDQAAYTMRRYRAIKNGKDCIVNVARRANRDTETFEKFMNTLIDGSKCITADAHEIVLCSTIDSTVSYVPRIG